MAESAENIVFCARHLDNEPEKYGGCPTNDISDIDNGDTLENITHLSFELSNSCFAVCGGSERSNEEKGGTDSSDFHSAGHESKCVNCDCESYDCTRVNDFFKLPIFLFVP